MKRYISLAALCAGLFLSSTAHAASFTNQDAVEEAEGHLRPCDMIPKQNTGCAFNRALFIKEYQNAYAGDHLAQENTGYDLWGGEGEEGTDPFLFNPVAACAWRIIAARAHKDDVHDDAEHIKMFCSSPSHNKYAAVYPLVDGEERVQLEIHKIMARIHAHTVHPVDVPEIDFKVSRDHDEDHAGDN